ncbi:type II toxin-antitoxin system RelE/ParE family toxin [Kumtagia ephedrae]|uniref:Killer protein n=1 Tax=Kumtagia ephedrae TaxID=2116701 RepID=A0A2P7SS08_9HYPH|nr:type II toxin-antitoxin system RelE/ParE family toxin [Mesorhizobium ephedrae]PSJ65266.1 Killer protein [Mesorhizobium ephedrae]
MIRSYKDRITEEVARTAKAPKGFPSDIVKRAVNKLTILNAANDIDDLKSPPGNHLEELHGDRKGQHSIRINDQWRICLVWNNGGADDVEIVDYHR